MAKNVLITGATGFVGASLVRHLLSRGGYEVSITARRSSNFWRIEDIRRDLSHIQYTDLSNKAEVDCLIDLVQPDVVYHVAAYGGFTSQTDSELTIRTNLHSTATLIDAAVRHDIPSFINTGSSSEYGIKDISMNEVDVCHPISLYAITKLAATHYCSMIGKTSSTRVCTLRLFSPYGELEDKQRLYPSIIHALNRDEAPRLSHPHSVRDFIPIQQVTQIYEAMPQLPFAPGDVINIGSGKQQTIHSFYTDIAAKLNRSHIQPVWGAASSRLHEPRMWQADVSKLQRLLQQYEMGDN